CHDRTVRRLNPEPGVSLDRKIQLVPGLAQSAVLGRQIVVACRGKCDGLVAEAADDVLKLDFGSPETDRIHVRDVVGDRVQALLERALGGEGYVDTGLQRLCPYRLSVAIAISVF